MIFFDNQNNVYSRQDYNFFYSRMKHILLRDHFIYSLLNDRILALEKVSGLKNPSDMLVNVIVTKI